MFFAYTKLKLLISFLLLILFCTKTEALEFSSSNYYWQNYVFDGKNYGKDFIATENTISHEIGDFTLHADLFSYNNKNYSEVDFGFGVKTAVSKINLEVGFWYYADFRYYNDLGVGGDYAEPYFSVSYDWILKPTLYLGYISYNHYFREVFSIEYSKKIADLSFTISPQIGNTHYDYQYQYFGIVISADYQINKNFNIFASFEIDRTIEAQPTTANSLSTGISISF